jgi:endonuclease/exonuclease/phosphatase family metal-dependent hydrolase
MATMKQFLMCLCLFAAIPACSKVEDNADYIPEYKTPDSGGETTSDTLGSNQVKVISFNIRVGTSDGGTSNAWDIRKVGIPVMFKKESPTVFGLQEALLMQMNYLRSNLSDYEGIGVGREDGKDSGEFMGIFYKKSLVTLDSWGTFWLSPTPDVPSIGWDAAYKRSATWAIFTLKKSGKKFFYLNTHLDQKGTLARKNGLLLICDKMKELNPSGYPALLTADFNSTIDDSIFDCVKAVMMDARSTALKTDNQPSFNGWGTSYSIIDHIFYSGWTAKVFRTIQDRYEGVDFLSDHYPVSAVLEFK